MELSQQQEMRDESMRVEYEAAQRYQNQNDNNNDNDTEHNDQYHDQERPAHGDASGDGCGYDGRAVQVASITTRDRSAYGVSA